MLPILVFGHHHLMMTMTTIWMVSLADELTIQYTYSTYSIRLAYCKRVNLIIVVHEVETIQPSFSVCIQLSRVGCYHYDYVEQYWVWGTGSSRMHGYIYY